MIESDFRLFNTATPKRATINNEGSTNTVSLYRVTFAPNGRIHATDSTALQRSSPDDTTPNFDTSPPTQSKHDQGRQLKDYANVFDRIVDHEDYPEGQLQRVRWCRYDQSADTLDPRYSLLDNFFRIYLFCARHL